MYRLFNPFSYLAGFLILILIAFLIILQYLLRNQRLFDRRIKALARAVPRVFGIRINCDSLRLNHRKSPCIYICNHVNIFDGFILYGYLPDFVRGLELDDHFRWPVWGQIVRILGNIPISHKDPAKAEESLAEASKALGAGTSLIILPEGHRTRDGKLRSFGKGAMRVARYSGVDIVPLAMKGAFECKKVHSPFVKPGVIELVSGPVIAASEIKSRSVTEIRNEAYSLIESLLKSP